MTMGEKIKMHRTRLGLSQEELGLRFGVNKAAVQKWENGTVENIKRSNIKGLADLFEISPCDLMSWDEPCDIHGYLASDKQLEKKIELRYGEETLAIVQSFSLLNEMGRKRVLENVQDLIAIQKYIKHESPKVLCRIARSDADTPLEELEYDEELSEELRIVSMIKTDDEL